MKKEWFLKVVCVCVCICAGLFLFTAHSNGQYSYNPYSYQQSYTPYGPTPYGPTPYGPNPYGPNVYQYLEDDYRPDYSKWNFTDSWTAYDPSGGGAGYVNWQPEYIGTSPYFQQIGYNPYNLNMPYNYGWSQPSYGYHQPSYGYQQAYNPYSYQQSYN
ncbi:MAG: hypothetical protein E3J23_00300, partial [Candidatus Stahlbacteria bacterium]